ncbi:MAG: hypothetical protein ACRC2B_24600 [Rubrivivax sp.]
MRLRRAHRFALATCVLFGILWAPGAASAQAARARAASAQYAALDPEIERRLLALDPQNISESEVREVLSHAPAPRIIGLQGSVPIVTMAPFAEFLVAMGYPAERLRNPRDGRLSYSSFTDSKELAGAIAWHYEREGLMPLLIGHSQGGMLVMKVLRDLAGASGERLPVWDPVRGRAENRDTIIDPRSGVERPVVGLQLPYAAALATGSPMRVLLGQWDMLGRLRSVPDSVEEFTGYFIAWDPIALSGPDAARGDPYRATGRARVRNLMLPPGYGHVTLPLAVHLADDPATRRWIGSFDPRTVPAEPPDMAHADLRNIVHAADIWFSIKRSWCLEAQRYARATALSPRTGS